MKEWKNIGQILIEHNILSPKSFARMLAVSKRHNKRIGWTLEKLELVTGEELAAALAQQYDLKMVSNLVKFSYPQTLLDLIPYEVAIQHLIFPLKQEGNNLLLAIADPTETKFIQNLSANLGLQIISCVATRKHIFEAICKFYLKQEMQEPEHDTVLIVEDEISTQATTQQLLIKEGYRVVTANDGLEGFNLMISQKPHVVLTDKVMPKFDGVTMLKSIQAVPELLTTPVILMSDKLTPQEEMKVFEQGFFDYIPKPINQITLVSRVKRALKFHRQQYSLF